MLFSTEKIDAILVATVAGQVNSANASSLEAQMLTLVDQGETSWLLDLSRLDYVSSAGLRVILMLAKRIRENSGQLVLCGLQPAVREVFEISGFLALLTVADTRADALAAFAAN